MLAARVANPQPHIGKIYHLIGPQSENMHVYAQYSYLLAMKEVIEAINCGQR